MAMRLIQGDVVAFDTETTGLRAWHGDMPFAFSFCNMLGDWAYVEFYVNPETRRVALDDWVYVCIYTAATDNYWIDHVTASEALEMIREVLEDTSVTKVMHNAKFDVRITELAYGIYVSGPGGRLRDGGRFEETMFMAHCCNSDEINYKLKRLADAYGGIDQSDQKLLQKTTAKLRNRAKKLGWKICIEEKPHPKGTRYKGVVDADYWIGRTLARYRPDLVPEGADMLCQHYAVLDVKRTIKLFCFYDQLMDDMGVRHTYQSELDLWPVVYEMEERGVHLDPRRNKTDMQFCIERWRETYKEVEARSWKGFNPDSPVQLQRLLYEKMKLPINSEYLTAKGKPGTGVDALKEMEDTVPVVKWVMKYRAAGKAYAYFARYEQLALPDHIIDPNELCLHADFRQLAAATARFSCGDPNLQQVTSRESSRSADPIDCRGPFGPRPGYVWLCVDYKGMEVRVFADVSQEPNMLRAIREGREIHDEVTNRGWGGRGNEAGLYETVHVLGLDGSEHCKNPAAKHLWAEWGMDPYNGGWKKLTKEDQRRIADEYLSRFDYDIVKSQAAIDAKVTKNKAKMVTFAKVYGGGPSAVKDLLHITLEEARLFMQQYDAAFPRVREYMKEMEREAKVDGCIWNRWGRRLTVPYDKAYKAVNYMVQGSSADLLKSAMKKCSKFFKQHDIDAHIIMTIHDELVFEVHKTELTKFLVRNVCRLMEDTDGCLNVPMPTDPSLVLRCWNEKTKLKTA